MKHFALFAAGALASCAAAPVEQPAPTSVFPSLSHAEFPGAQRLLEGFDERTPDVDWVPGDRALFGLRLETGDEAFSWLLDVEALAPATIPALSHAVRVGDTGWMISTDPVPTDVVARVFDGNGHLLTDTRIRLPAGYLSRGVLAAIDRSRTSNASPAEPRLQPGELLELIRDQHCARLAIQSMLSIVQHDEELAAYFWQVVEKPSVWSVLGHFGITVDVDLPFEASIAAEVPASLPPADRACSVPMRIDVNGSPALFLDLLVVDARRPYSLCAGIVAAIARHPSDAGVRLRLQLLAARCGNGGSESS